MIVLRIEHPVPDFEAWTAAFEADPIGREKGGVRRYRVLRALDDPNYLMVDLEFDSREPADAMRGALEALWGRVQQEGLIGDQQARIAEVVDAREY